MLSKEWGKKSETSTILKEARVKELLTFINTQIHEARQGAGRVSSLSSLKACISWRSFLMAGKGQTSHPFQGGRSRELQVCQPHVRPAAGYGMNPLQNHFQAKEE